MMWFDFKYYDPSYEWTDEDEDEWQASCDVRRYAFGLVALLAFDVGAIAWFGFSSAAVTVYSALVFLAGCLGYWYWYVRRMSHDSFSCWPLL